MTTILETITGALERIRRASASEAAGMALAAALLAVPGPSMAAWARHAVKAEMDPPSLSIRVTDEVELDAPIAAKGIGFVLHRGLKPEVLEKGFKLTPLPGRKGLPEYGEAFLLNAPGGASKFTLSYGGEIHHEPVRESPEYARGFAATPGIVSPEGVYLAGESLWVPDFGCQVESFTLTADIPEGWDAVSQGELKSRTTSKGRASVVWSAGKGGEEIYLVAAPFTVYRSESGRVPALVYLRTPEPALAAKFIDVTDGYVRMYEDLIGRYPFEKFAVVENFWETGFGMPSFTLLGSKVLRFPFILRTSYPHEILHNWWGNGVYADYARGNWAEGLTAYLADHLMREQAGAGAEYRESTLQKYADFVSKKADKPLASFTHRHDSASEAIGYGKSLMVFNMLRVWLGDDAFRAGLRGFYETNLGKKASWDDLRKAFEKSSGMKMGWFFDQWVKRRGAPSLSLVKAEAAESGGGWTVKLKIKQDQGGEAFRMKVPVALTIEGRGETVMHYPEMRAASQELVIRAEGKPVRVDLDPWFEAMRLIGPGEIPPALSGAFGSAKTTAIIPSAAPPELREAYRKFAGEMAASWEGELKIAEDGELNELPREGGVWILGYENIFAGEAEKAFKPYPVKIAGEEIELSKSAFPREGLSVVVTSALKDWGKGTRPLTFLASTSVAALPGLARKLPHYSKYSYLAFAGDAPDNVAKGRFDPSGGKLTAVFADKAERGRQPKTPPLAMLPSPYSGERMMRTVEFLASPALEGRGFGSPGVEKAALYIAEKMGEAGLKPGGMDGGWFGTFAAPDENGRETLQKNVVGYVPGAKPEYAGQALVVGAHYDGLGLGWPDARAGNRGLVHPGADDNASGVAVMLEMARKTAALAPDRDVVFVAFAGEETKRAGSEKFLAGPSPWQAAKMTAMINLDTVGRLGSGKILAFGASSAREWPFILNGAAFVTGAKVEPVMKDMGSSDQTSFLAAGVPAIQLFTGPHAGYHAPGDTVEGIDPDGMAAVAGVAMEAVEYLAKRPTPLSPSLGKNAGANAGGGGPRKVFLGTVPDFAHQGAGMKIQEVVPGSPAEKAGLKAGDLITSLNGEKTGDLKAFSEIMKKMKPGDTAVIEFLRDGQSIRAEATAAER